VTVTVEYLNEISFVSKAVSKADLPQEERQDAIDTSRPGIAAVSWYFHHEPVHERLQLSTAVPLRDQWCPRSWYASLFLLPVFFFSAASPRICVPYARAVRTCATGSAAPSAWVFAVPAVSTADVNVWTTASTSAPAAVQAGCDSRYT
jgi:hypothetical protein